MSYPANGPLAGDKTEEAFLRIKADKVTQLLNLVGELSLAAASVRHQAELEGVESDAFESVFHRMDLLVRDLQTLASDLRLIPVAGVFRQMQRLARDLSHQTGKPLDLVLEGGETEIDKVVVDELGDPLVHLIRNAVDHGLEPPTERAAAGKPERGCIRLAAANRGGEILITVSDDGRGLNRARILERCRKLGLFGPTDEPEEVALWDCIFHPGFSTAGTVSSLSGRGVGMDVVQNRIQALRGRVVVSSRPGQGTRVTMHIPLSLAFQDSMIIRSQSRLYAIPVEAIQEIFQPHAGQIVHAAVDRSEAIRVREEMAPICRLQRFYREQGAERPLAEQVMVMIQSSKGIFCLPVDEIIGQQQVTMKPLQGELRHIRAGAGWAMMGSGEVVLALDCERLGADLL
jgi:two-component system chemotaxis sensor kinase CheA